MAIFDGAREEYHRTTWAEDFVCGLCMVVVIAVSCIAMWLLIGE